MLSALIPSIHSSSYAVPARTPGMHHMRSIPGPSNFLRPRIGTELSHDVLNSSRTALMGEQPNPWDRLTAPGCDEPTSRCQTSPSMNSWGDKPVIPGSFYPLSDGPSMRNHRITKSFRPCSTCRSRSQAPLCLYTL